MCDLYKLCFQNYCASLIYVVINRTTEIASITSWCKRGGGQKQPSEQPTFNCNAEMQYFFYQILVRQTQQTHLENVHKDIINILPISFLKFGGGGRK